MAALTTTLLVAGLAASAIGTGISVYGGIKQQEAAKKAEDAREKQLSLDSARRRRQILRNAIIARSNATSNAAGQGALLSSGLEGGRAGVSAEAGRQTLAVNQNESLGGQIFSANRDAYTASGIQGFGQGVSTIGGTILNNIGTIDRLATYSAGNTFGAPVPRPNPLYV